MLLTEFIERTIIDAPRCVIGVDPGMSGAAFQLGRGVLTGYRDFTTYGQIASSIWQLCHNGTPVDFAVIEDVHAFPGQGVVSMFNFGKAAGAAEAALTLSLRPGVPAVSVTPQRWQGFYRELLRIPRKTDFDSRATALRLFPSSENFLTRAKDHNSADALLMAAWGCLLPQIKQAGS